MLSRLEEKAKIIIVMTRWHSLDLAGRALEHFKAAGSRVILATAGSVISIPSLVYKTFST